ncbi:MAG TPA: hypothetical protein VM012_13875 [Flavitalea sp.]|nr:hypothetical protein [Flavitalea sp.]
MHLIEVTDSSLANEFIQVNVRINASNANYIRPLDKDIHDVFDKKKNKAFRHGAVTRWILKDDDGNSIGRIAAFINKKYKNKGDEMPVGGIGFFDCINDQSAAELLFNVAKHWLIATGVEAMDGPINFGERDRWWGLLVEGFEPPIYCMNFNPPYYATLFEQYGFRAFVNQLCFALKVSDPLQPKFFERHAKIAADPQFSARHIRKNNLKKFAEDFTIVYNKAWAGHGGLKELHPEVVLKMFKQMKPIMDERVIWFGYYKENPVAIWTNLPDINQWFRFLNGNFNWWGKVRFIWYKATRKCTKFTGLVFGIIPEWQGKGVDSYIIVEGAKIIQGKHLYNDYEMQWIGEFNPKMINIAESLGTYRSRKLITYRYLFDQTREFKPHPIV